MAAGFQKRRDQAGDEADDEFDRLSAQTTADPTTDPYANETYTQDTGDWGWQGDPMGGGDFQEGGPTQVAMDVDRIQDPLSTHIESRGWAPDPDLLSPIPLDQWRSEGFQEKPPRGRGLPSLPPDRKYWNNVNPAKILSAQGGGIQPGGPGPIMGGGIRAFRRGGEPEGPSFDPNLDVTNYRNLIDVFGDKAPIEAQSGYLETLPTRALQEKGNYPQHPEPRIPLPRPRPQPYDPEDVVPGRSLSMNYQEGGDTDFGDVDVANPHLDEDRAPLPRGAVYPELEAMKWLGQQPSPDMPDIGPRSQPPSFTPPDQRGQIVGGGEQALPPTEFKGWGSAIRGIPAPEEPALGAMDPEATRRLISGFQVDPVSGEPHVPSWAMPFPSAPAAATPATRPAAPSLTTPAAAATPPLTDPLSGERLSSDPRGDPIRDPMGDFATGALAPGEQVPMPRPAAHPWERASTQSVHSIIADEWTKARMSPTGIAGILQNVGDESGFRPWLRHPDQPDYGGEAHFAHGLYQHGGDDWNKFTWWKGLHYPNESWQNPRIQSEFDAWNLKTTKPDTFRRMSEAKTPGEAAAIYVREWLRPRKDLAEERARRYLRGSPQLESYFRPETSSPELRTRMAALSGVQSDAGPEEPYAAGATPAQYRSPIPSRRDPGMDAYDRAPGRPADDRGLFGTGLFSRGWGERLQHDPVRMALIQAGAGMLGASSRPGSLGAAAAAGFGGFGTGLERGEAEQRQELKSDRDYELKAQSLYDRLMQHQDAESRTDRRLQFQERTQGERLKMQMEQGEERAREARIKEQATVLGAQNFVGDPYEEAARRDSLNYPLPAIEEENRREGFRYRDTKPGNVWHSQKWLDAQAEAKRKAEEAKKKKPKPTTSWWPFGGGASAEEP
jgi:hypothetical protein